MMNFFIATLPIWILVSGAIIAIISYVVSEVKDKKKLEFDSTKNHVDISRIFSRMITYLPLVDEQSVEMRNLKSKINRLDTFVQKLNNEELSHFEAQCAEEIPALLKIQKTMLTPKFNVKNETLMELIEFVIDNLTIHSKESEKLANIDLKGELEQLKSIKAKRESLIESTNKS
ncbi:hypothetical protein ABD91_21200 [Lysinibacillus sphaericus]|uniref:hypothetical protein n=1 Tax=Lysinibacillus sphaericus TaxID=1421 RepID=UPI0018CE05CD|nr:hypothetical protein [Lysinibacillus sphaericus]MBG9693257.1 hypothetical protein [Lysinibacillus sphaericus]